MSVFKKQPEVWKVILVTEFCRWTWSKEDKKLTRLDKATNKMQVFELYMSDDNDAMGATKVAANKEYRILLSKQREVLSDLQ